MLFKSYMRGFAYSTYFLNYYGPDDLSEINNNLNILKLNEEYNFPNLEKFIIRNKINKLLDLKNLKITGFMCINLIEKDFDFQNFYPDKMISKNDFNISEKLNKLVSKFHKDKFSSENICGLIALFLKDKFYYQDMNFSLIDQFNKFLIIAKEQLESNFPKKEKNVYLIFSCYNEKNRRIFL